MQQSSSDRSDLEFELLAEIAVGATARVELCRVVAGSRDGELVAVKRLHPHVSEDPAIVDMFRDEVWMTAALEHPHVVKLVGWGQDPPGPWLAVELVRGVSLQRLMKTVFDTGEQFSERMVVYIARCVCDGLAEAHALRSADGQLLHLVHRDLTPSNVLLGFGGQVKITDFGLAKAKQRLTKTLTGMVKGQPWYMAPEQVKGDAIDARSDLFALGVVLFELFAGQRPWAAASELESMRAITDEPPSSLATLRASMDSALVEVVESCLAKDPGERCQNAVELRDRFDDWLAAHGYQRDTEQALARFVRRNAMRQMRWFERAVAGEMAEQAREDAAHRMAGRGLAPAAAVPDPPADPPTLEPTSATRKGTLGTSPTAAEVPRSRAPGRQRQGSDSGVQSQPPGRAATSGAPASGAPPNIDWGEDGPTLIQRPSSGSSARPSSVAPPAGPAVEPTTRRQRRPAALAKHPAMPGAGLGVPAPPDPDAPPLPQAPAAPSAPSARLPPSVNTGGTATAIKTPAGRAAPTDQEDAPTIQTRLPLPPAGAASAAPAVGEEVVPVPVPGLPSMPSSDGRSSDFLAEARRLGEEASNAAEAARHAADVAEAAARAAALAAEASLLAASGEQHEAVQRLREAQLVDEALRRGEIPRRMPLGAGSRLLAGGAAGFWGRMARGIGSQQGATAVVVGTVTLLVLLVLIVAFLV